MEKLENLLELGGLKKDIILLVVSGISLLLSLLDIPFFFDLAWIAIVCCGLPIILEAIIGLITEFDIKADVLVSLALIASVCIGEIFAAGEVAFIMQLGALLEDLTVSKARQGIEKLVHLTPRKARVIRQGNEIMIAAQDVVVGDMIKVLPGETIPVDGIIVEGNTSVNQAVMTGESLPVDKVVTDEVSSGTMNQFGSFVMKANRVGEDSSIQRMIRLVQEADASKAKIVSIADRWATWIVVIALTSAILTGLITGELIRSVTILVVFCPCALVLATPTAIMAAIGNATKHGFLVKEGDALERLANVKRVVFDKTGTLTYGTLSVTYLYSDEINETTLFQYCASVESHSEHPLGKAIVHDFRDRYQLQLLDVDDFEMYVGQGVKGVVHQQKICVGTMKLLHNNKVKENKEILQQANDYIQQGCSVVYVSLNEKMIGFVVLSDTIRKQSQSMIQTLKSLNIIPVLLTGDHQRAASHIAHQLSIDDVHGECLPEDKMTWIDHYQNHHEDVCMIGDGINDAPALKKASVGIAMGGIGSDIAIEAASIALINDDIQEFPHLIALSRKMMKTIHMNLIFSLSLNFLAIILAMTGLLHPVIGALVHNAGSVVVIIHSSLLLKWKQ